MFLGSNTDAYRYLQMFANLAHLPGSFLEVGRVGGMRLNSPLKWDVRLLLLSNRESVLLL